MRGLVVSLLLAGIAGCATGRTHARATAHPLHDWPYAPPDWFPSEAPPGLDGFAAQISCHVFGAAGGGSALSAWLTRSGSIIDASQFAALERAARHSSEAYRLHAPRVRVPDGQAAWVAITKETGGTAFWVRCTQTDDSGATVSFATDAAFREPGRPWNESRCWRIHATQRLRPGQALLYAAAPPGQPAATLVAVRLDHVEPARRGTVQKSASCGPPHVAAAAPGP